MLLGRAMLLASPLVATVGLSLGIPLAMLTDVYRNSTHFSPSLLGGTLAVWAGFVAVSASETMEGRARALYAACVERCVAAPPRAPRGRAATRPAKMTTP